MSSSGLEIQQCWRETDRWLKQPDDRQGGKEGGGMKGRRRGGGGGVCSMNRRRWRCS